jgi:type IV secretory pathway protease TraF
MSTSRLNELAVIQDTRPEIRFETTVQRSIGFTFLRRLILLLIVVLSVTVAICTQRPNRFEDAYITSGSMAQSFWGPSFLVKCGDCGYSFRCDAEKKEFVPSDFRAVCPNCAHGDNSLTHTNLNEYGQQVNYDSRSADQGALKRWTTVAFQASGVSKTAGIKRIVGLPSEWIEIRQGDIHVDGRLLRKSLPTQRELAVLVHDATHRSIRKPASNPWQAASEVSAWTQTHTGFVFHATRDSPSEVIDWLEYRNRPNEPKALGMTRPAEAPINDNLGYNQAISRELNEVRDIMLSCWVRLSGAGGLVLSADDGVHPIEIDISADDNTLSVRVEDQVIQRVRIPSLASQQRKLELSLFDRQFLFAIDGRTLIKFQLPGRPLHPLDSRPLRIGASNLRVWVSQLRVYRDIFYLNDRGLALPWRVERRLGPDEYFLLGDNPPISLDSRHWPHMGVTRKSLIGTVLREMNEN